MLIGNLSDGRIGLPAATSPAAFPATLAASRSHDTPFWFVGVDKKAVPRPVCVHRRGAEVLGVSFASREVCAQSLV